MRSIFENIWYNGAQLRLALLLSISLCSCVAINPTKTEISTEIPLHYIVVPDQSPSIQSAIDWATDGDTILVRPGTYYEHLYFFGYNVVVGSQILLSGNEDYIAATKIVGYKSRSVVSFTNGESRAAKLTGFTIQNGDTDYGGGIYIRGSSPTLENLHIVGNTAERTGGGIYITGACNPLIKSTTITNNSADVGGGISSRFSSFKLISSKVDGNSAEVAGGGIQCTRSDTIIINNSIISDNEAPNAQGGGLFMRDVKSVFLNNVSIFGNSAFQGGGIYSSSTRKISIENSRIYSNTSQSQGGGIYSYDQDSKYVSTLIYGNAASKGGGIFCYTNSMVLDNLTLCNNVAEEVGGIYTNGGSLTIVNSIIWGNSDHEVECNWGRLIVLHSDIEAGLDSIKLGDNGQIDWLDGNIDTAPKFIDAELDDYSLQFDSPCIDAGINFYTIDGDTVISIPDNEYNGEAPDMGAFEYNE